MTSAVIVCGLALLFEGLFGYPDRLFAAIGHPVTWIGALIAWLDRVLNKDGAPPSRRRAAGGAAVAVVVAISGVVAATIAATMHAVLPQVAATLILAAAASTCLAQRSLDAHVRAVAAALESEGIGAARRAVACIVGRETAALEAAGVARAAIESLAENFADGIVAPIVWLAIFGLPGGVLYKAVNTADSMIGHRTPRHEAFGFCAAKLDDVASWPGSRLAALWLVVAAAFTPGASPREAWRVMRRDARGHPSPNAGWPEAAMAGALSLRLGGPRAYAGLVVEDAYIGDGTGLADASSVRSALRLYRVACGLQLVAVAILALLIVR